MTVKRYEPVSCSGTGGDNWTEMREEPDGIWVAFDDYDALAALLDFCVQQLECELVHHDKGEYHKSGEPCPVMARLRSALPDQGKEI